MKLGGGVIAGVPRATVFPTSLFRRSRISVTCSSVSSTPDHVTFIKDIAATQPPQHLTQLLRMLKAKGESIISPGAKQGLIPLAIPLTKNNSGTVTALLRWPTAPPGILVEEDAKSTPERRDELFNASDDAGEKLYRKGDFIKSNISNVDVYLLKKVGLFPDVLERRVMSHLKEGDHVSALVAGEFYTRKEHFPGFARPFVFNAEVLLKVGRRIEAKDAARGALKSPWWTLGCKYHDVAEIAEWEDEQIEFIKEKVSEEGRQEDLRKGKAPSQVVLDEAAFLLDLASVDGTWEDYLERMAECYKEAGLPDIARFILYRD